MPVRKSRVTESQTVSIRKHGDAGVPSAEILRQHSLSKAPYVSDCREGAGLRDAPLGASCGGVLTPGETH